MIIAKIRLKPGFFVQYIKGIVINTANTSIRKGENIPLISRIISVGDAFDAMTNTRPYRRPIAKKEALDEILKNSGSQFDPNIVQVFINYSDRIIEKGDIIMCDYGLQYKCYHTDHARTYCIDPIPEKFKERYLILKQAYLEVVEDYLRDGNPVSLLYNKMKELIEKQDKKLGKYFQGDGFYYQGLGHGLGLELDEPPYILPNKSEELKENMVIALEPKLIIPNWGAIDFEDDFIVKKGKPEKITNTEYLY